MGAATASLWLSSCSDSTALSGAAQILAQCDSFKGKAVRASGYLGKCAGYDCQLFADKKAWRDFTAAWQHMHAIQTKRETGREEREVWSAVNAMWPVGIGGNEAFDRKAAPLQHSYVIITGRMAKDSCTGLGGTDRSPGISPTDIRAWTLSEGAPANT
ncbi:hypothetical protein [Sphingomonas sp. UYAg733]